MIIYDAGRHKARRERGRSVQRHRPKSNVGEASRIRRAREGPAPVSRPITDEKPTYRYRSGVPMRQITSGLATNGRRTHHAPQRRISGSSLEFELPLRIPPPALR